MVQSATAKSPVPTSPQDLAKLLGSLGAANPAAANEDNFSGSSTATDGKSDARALAAEDPNIKARQILEKTIAPGSSFSGLIKDVSPSSPLPPTDLTGVPIHDTGGTIKVKPGTRRGDIKKLVGAANIIVPFGTGQITNHLKIERVVNMAEPMYRIFIGDNVQNPDPNSGTNIIYVSPYHASQVLFSIERADGSKESLSLSQIPEQGNATDVKVIQDIENHRYGSEIWHVYERLFTPESFARHLNVPLEELQDSFYKNLQAPKERVSLGKTKYKDLKVWKDVPVIRSSDLFTGSQGTFYDVESIGSFDPKSIQALKDNMLGPYKADLSAKLDQTAQKSSKEKYVFLTLKATEKAVSVPTYQITEDLDLKVVWGDSTERFIIPRGTLLTRLQAETLLALSHGTYNKEGMPKEISLHRANTKTSSKQGETNRVVSEGSKVALEKVLARKTTYMIFDESPERPGQSDFRGALTVDTPDNTTGGPKVNTILVSDRDNGLHASKANLQGIDAHTDPVRDDNPLQETAKLKPASVDLEGFRQFTSALSANANFSTSVDYKIRSASEQSSRTTPGTSSEEKKLGGFISSIKNWFSSWFSKS
jgi:hypothetical protein